jgi:hypothetical protein
VMTGASRLSLRSSTSWAMPSDVNDFEMDPMSKIVRVLTGSMGLQVSKAVSLFEHDPAVFDHRQRRARDAVPRHEAQH